MQPPASFSPFAWPIHHIGIAVPSLDDAAATFVALGGGAVSGRELVQPQQVEVLFIELPNVRLELLSPTAPTSPVQRFLERRGAGLHHICYEVPDIDAALAQVHAAGFELIDAQPRIGAHQARIAFLHPRSTGGALIELAQFP